MPRTRPGYEPVTIELPAAVLAAARADAFRRGVSLAAYAARALAFRAGVTCPTPRRPGRPRTRPGPTPGGG